jgi:putative hydrolase of the HAD superfamily
MKYKHLFFDLDGTLWDLHLNTRAALAILRDRFQLPLHNDAVFDQFVRTYFKHNDAVWKLYREQKIEKHVLRSVRFEMTFRDMQWAYDAAFIEQFGEAFIEVCPSQPHLIPGTMEMLRAFHGVIPMHIITNGFKEVQGIKMEAGKINGFFQHVVNSEDVGVRKPYAPVFHHAMQLAGADPATSLMIGDDWEADILGARDVGMDTAWLKNGEGRHNFKPTYIVADMADLWRQLTT